jgi:L-fuculose-phosphate aldolase
MNTSPIPESVAEEMAQVGRLLYTKNLIAASDGNLSQRLSAETIVVTGSGTHKGFLSADDLVLTSLQGTHLFGQRAVTSESAMHLRVYSLREDVDAVIHAHPPYATALTLAGLTLEVPILPELVMAFGGIPTAPYTTPGSPENAEAITPFIRQTDVLLLERHGALTVGKTLREAFFKMEKLEHAAEIVWRAYAIREPQTLTPDQIEKILQSRRRYGVSAPWFPPRVS